MKTINILNYQGNKASLMPFISKEIDEIANPGDTVVDLFSGSGSVSRGLKDKYRVIANDAEKYASIISASLLIEEHTQEELVDLSNRFNELFDYHFIHKIDRSHVKLEEKLVSEENTEGLIELYNKIPTVWDTSSGITPFSLKNKNKYDLFEHYYAGSYFGLKQSIEIDTIILAINKLEKKDRNVLYACLFYAMKEVVFSKDGHMAQPLNIKKNADRHIIQRKKSIIKYFFIKLKDFVNLRMSKNSGDHIVYNENFEDILNDKILKYSPTVIYADPPYTDMQYSRYYHLLNVAVNYDYPELTMYRNAYTKGLYTEGRNQSKLSQRSKAKDQLRNLLEFSKRNCIKVVLSYAYPENQAKQAIDRYTVTIEELVDLAKGIYGDSLVYLEKTTHNHANHRNSTRKKVYEYLIVCGHEREVDEENYNVRELKKVLNSIKPTSRNDLYNSHLYWSQKSFNIIDELIKGLSKRNEIVFDPFMGSGVTILESVKKGIDRNAIGCDVNEMPLFISNTLLGDMFNGKAREVLNQFSSDINKFQKYYETECEICKEQATISKIIFDKPHRTNNDGVKIHSVYYECAKCGKMSKLPSREDYKKMLFQEYETNTIEDIELIHNSKIAVGKEDRISYIFTPRNFMILDKLTSRINSYEYSNIPKYLLMSILHLSKISDTHSNSQWPLWIPKINCVEKNIITTLQRKIKAIEKTIKYTQKNYYPNSLVSKFDGLNSNNALMLKKGSQHITREDIVDDSVSLIITDPPYMEQVLYSEYMQLYKPFLNLQFNLDDEIVVSSSPKRDKTEEGYFDLLDEVFEMCSKKLKEDGYMCLFFHDSNLNIWVKLINILEKNGFKFVSQVHIKKSKTVKNILSPKKSLNGDAVLFFQNIKVPLPKVEIDTEMPIIEKSIFDQAKILIQASDHGALSTPELYDNGLMEVLIENGWLNKFASKYKSLVDFFEDKLIWSKETGEWKIP